MPHKKENPTLALALSGGAARAIAMVGVLQAFEDAGIGIDAVAGTSAGSLVGALYLDGMGTDELARLAARTKWRSLFVPGLSKTGLISSAGIYGFLKEHLNAATIEELPKPLAVVCADLVGGERVVLTSGPLARAVQASCSLPVIFTPTNFGGKMLIDGGYVSQVPVIAARELGAKVVVAVDVNYNAARPALTNVVGISLHLAQMIARRNADAELPLADVVISVDVRGIQLYDIKKHAELIRRGRKAAGEKMGDIIRALERAGRG
ncbi:MAG TPA: patatin-like phospholipase family protein [Nitrospirota bacterium]|nr:patatin-like phospholipase family protein [Nitrospirota bacterium]